MPEDLTQLDLEAFAPTVFAYRNQREKYLTMIMNEHSATLDEAKRLPNIILSSGHYTTWLRKYKKTPVEEVRRFSNKLTMEIHALRSELVRNARFSWASIDKKHLLQLGKDESSVEALLLPRIIARSLSFCLRFCIAV